MCFVQRNFLKSDCTWLSQFALNGIKELGPLAMPLCNTCMEYKKYDSFIRCQTTEKLNQKLMDELEKNNDISNMDENIYQIAGQKMGTVLKTTCNKMSKSFAAAIAKKSQNENKLLVSKVNKRNDTENDISKCIREEQIWKFCPNNVSFKKYWITLALNRQTRNWKDYRNSRPKGRWNQGRYYWTF